MLESLIALLAPHHCVGCEREGTLLCQPCAIEAREASQPRCIMCNTLTETMFICQSCTKGSNFAGLWASADYQDAVKKLLFAYKFERAKAAYRPLAQLLDDTTPQLFTTAVVVNIPTDGRRARHRGYDHTALLARQLAKQRGMRYACLLSRRQSTRQLGASRATRFRQAKELFHPVRQLPPDTDILLIDDVMTTGATMRAAAAMCKKAGARHIFGAVCAYEQLK